MKKCRPNIGNLFESLNLICFYFAGGSLVDKNRKGAKPCKSLHWNCAGTCGTGFSKVFAWHKIYQASLMVTARLVAAVSASSPYGSSVTQGLCYGMPSHC